MDYEVNAERERGYYLASYTRLSDLLLAGIIFLDYFCLQLGFLLYSFVSILCLISLAESSQSRAVNLMNHSGCARTDFQSNYQISQQARQRWSRSKEDSNLQSDPLPASLPVTPNTGNKFSLVKPYECSYKPIWQIADRFSITR